MRTTTAVFVGSLALLSTVRADYTTPSIVSWGAPRIDLFGTRPNGDIWHKYQTTYGWEPHSGTGRLELFSHASARSAVSTTSWGANRLNFVFVDDDGVVRHKYWTGYGWGPVEGYEDLGKGPIRGIKITSWGENRLDIIGLSHEGHVLHKAWTGSSWYPAVDSWEDLGGVVIEDPVAVSWGADRLDIFGLSDTGAIIHKFWTHGQWEPEAQVWEKMGEKKFSTAPIASAPAVGQVDVWAVDKHGELSHLFWDGSSWLGWTGLGGNFTTTPQVVHFSPKNIDLVGRNASNPGEYLYKHWDGYAWSPWYSKAGSFASEPAAIRLADDNLQITGVDTTGKVVFQVWNGNDWFPGPASWYEIADLEADDKQGVLCQDQQRQEPLLVNQNRRAALRFEA